MFLLLLKVAAFLSYKLLKCLMEKQNPSKRERETKKWGRERERERELEIDAILLFRS
jgi:hypothetical protein